MTEDIDLICVTGVEYVKGYTMRLEFSNGKVKLVMWYIHRLPILETCCSYMRSHSNLPGLPRHQ